MELLDKVITLIEKAVISLSGVCLTIIMLLITVDVVMRYVFSSPLSWSFDLISLYLATLLFFAAVSDTFRRGSHVKIDLFDKLGSVRVRAALEVIGFVSALVLFYLMFRLGVEDGIDSYVKGHVIAGAIHWPTWIPYMIVALGYGLLSLRIVVTILERIKVLITGVQIERAVEHLE
ncbi:TRAP transporter small permease [Sneathiella sp.]|uniref:TRAP transporter small permease n=1 Tax=Sneathiella sp. TaxID=1964365 RepID=UPI002FE2D6BE